MTDRYHSLVVVLEEDVREDDAEGLMAAVVHLRGVLSVSGVVADLDSKMAEGRARFDLQKQLRDVLYARS